MAWSTTEPLLLLYLGGCTSCKLRSLAKSLQSFEQLLLSVVQVFSWRTTEIPWNCNYLKSGRQFLCTRIEFRVDEPVWTERVAATGSSFKPEVKYVQLWQLMISVVANLLWCPIATKFGIGAAQIKHHPHCAVCVWDIPKVGEFTMDLHVWKRGTL